MSDEPPIELKPCPFCGGAVEQVRMEIVCTCCSAITVFSICSVDSHSRRLWNSRAHPSPDSEHRNTLFRVRGILASGTKELTGRIVREITQVLGDDFDMGDVTQSGREVDAPNAGVQIPSPPVDQDRREIPVVDEKALVRIAGKAYMQSGEDKGCYSAKAMGAAIAAIRSYLRTTKPVSISLVECAAALERDIDDRGRPHTAKECAKVVLDAAGVKYVD